MSLTQRSVSSVAWQVGTNLTRVGVLFARSVLLARLLPIYIFGIYALAGSVVSLTVLVANFGMGGAFLHRAPETANEKHAADVHFTLKLTLTLVWALLLLVGAFLFTEGETRTALVVLTLTTTGVELAQTPRLILTRRVVHRRLALIPLINALLTTAIAVALAWQGFTIWALLAANVVALIVTILAFYVWRPVWRPRLTWSPPTMRYYLGFGSRNFVASLLLTALDRLDDLWAGLYLGQIALGYYSRAYTFATYPRQVLAVPVNTVVRGTYAELKGDRRRLSQAFFRANSLLLRTGFFFAGLLALVAPEFIVLLLGAKWLPMLDAFRLMLVFTMLDPIRMTISHVFVAVGVPEQVVRARIAQLVVLVVGLFALGITWGIAGVALAVNLMLVVGIAILLWQARVYVDFSLMRLFVAPGLALMVGLLLGHAVLEIPGVEGPDWLTAVLKVGTFTIAYALVWLALERMEAVQMLRTLVRNLSGSGGLVDSARADSDDGD
jgi:O-antigen/teichoic acid export membrane protein